MAENVLFTDQAEKPIEKGNFDYNVDAPVLPMKGEDENLVPNKAASEDALMAGFIEYGSPSAQQVLDIQQDYEQRGANQIIEDIRTRGADRDNQNIINGGLDAVVNGQMTQEQLLEGLANTRAKSADDITDLHLEYLQVRMNRQQAKTVEEKIINEQKMEELVRKGYPVDKIIADRVEWLKSTLDPSVGNLTVGILTDILPFATTIPFARAFNKVFPDAPLDPTFNPATGFGLGRGERALEIRKRMEGMEPAEKYQVAKDFMDAIMQEDGALTGQDFQRMLILQEALEGEQLTLGPANVDRIIGNAITLLDAVGVGGVAKGLFRLGKSMFRPGSPVDTIVLADDLSASELAAAGIRNDMKAALDMDQVEMIEVAAGVTNWKKDIVLLPMNIIRMLDRGKREATDLINRTRGNTLIVSEAEKSVAAKELRHQVQQVGNAGFIGSHFTADKLDDGLRFTAKYGVIDAKGNTHAYTSALDAFEAAQHSFPTAVGLKIFRKSPKGLLTEVKKSQINKRVGEYVFEIEGFKPYATVLNPAEKLFYNDGDILATGPLVDYLLDPASRHAKWMSDAFAQAGDQGRGIRHQLGKIAEPFAKLKIGKKREVAKLLDKYAKDSAKMDTSAIMRAAGDDLDVLRGFFSYRQTMDTLWHLENRAFREDLVTQGAKHLVIGDYAAAGVKQSADALLRSAGRAQGKQLEVYDALKGSMVKLDAQAVNKLLADGKSIYKVREPVGDLARQSDLVIVSKADQVRELPAAVLKKIDGYIPRHYKETYWVRKIVSGTKNGRKTQNFQILRAVGDRAEANQVVRELKASGQLTDEEAKRAITHDRTMNPKERASVEQQDNISLGRMFYHKRADQRVRGIDGFAEISDPVEAMVKNIDSTSRFVGNDQLLSTMKQRWLGTFGRELGLVDPKKGFPLTEKEIGSAISGTPAEKAAALEQWLHITKTESISTTEGEAWRNFWITAVDKIIGNSAADTIAGAAKALGTWPMKVLAENSPNKIIRSVAFYHLIAGNPIRQAYVQAQQFMFISALAPLEAPKIIVQNKAVMLGLMRDAFPKIYKAQKGVSAKVMGMSTKEYDDFIDGYIKTGIPHSVDSHDYVANALVHYSQNISGNIAERALHRSKNIALAPFKAMKKVGFDYGELSNLTSTFLLARSRLLKATGKKQLTSIKDFQTAAADARNMALDMTRTGAFRYQDGLLSGVTQFLSIQHKALLAIMPFKKLGNQSFTRAERVRIAAGQLILNGVTGWGGYEMYKGWQNMSGTRIDEKYDKFIVGGMYEYVMNNIFHVLTGDEDMQNLNVAGAVAPAGGIHQKIGDMAEMLIGNEHWTEMFAGTNVINRWTDMGKTMLAMQRYPELNNDKDFQNMISNFASITSGWNQFIKGRAAMRLGWHVNSHGSPTVQASYGSAIVEQALGISPRTLDEMYALQDEYSNRTLRENHVFPDADSETTQVAASMYKSMTRTVTIFQDEFNPDVAALNTDQLTRLHKQRMDEGLEMMASIRALYTPIERDRIWQKFQDLAKKDRTRHTKGLIDTILRKIVVGDISGDQVAPVIAQIRAAGLITPGTPEDQRMQFIIEQLFKSMQGREELSNSVNEQIQEIYNAPN